MKIALFGALALVASAFLPACGGSALDDYANDVCKCKDANCLKEVETKYKDKMKGMDKPEDLMKMSESDQKALAKAMGCALEASGLGK